MSLEIISPFLHPRFENSNGDIFILSSDGVVFGLRKDNMKTYGGAFPLDKVISRLGVETLILEECSQTLEVVFEFLFPKRYPDLEDKDFMSLISIANAVEKYKVFGAMHTCAARLRVFVRRHPERIFAHAVTYDCPESLVNEAASKLMFCNLLQIAEVLPSHAILTWLRYRQSVNKTIFGSARGLLSCAGQNLVPCSTKVLSDGSHMNISCKTGFAAWIAYLESLTTRAAFEEEIKDKPYFKRSIGTNCNLKEDPCHWLVHLAKLLKVGLKSADSIKFTLGATGEQKCAAAKTTQVFPLHVIPTGYSD